MESKEVKVSTGRYYVEAVIRPFDEIFDDPEMWEDVTSEICSKHLLGIFSAVASEMEGYNPFDEKQVIKRYCESYFVEDGDMKFIMRIINAYKLDHIKL